MQWTFDWMWQLDSKYAVWRAPILPIEEQWKLMLPMGRLVHKMETQMSSKNPAVLAAAGAELRQHLLDSMASKKNKDADGMRTCASWALHQRSPKATTQLLGAIESKVTAPQFRSFMTAVSVCRFAEERNHVNPEHWAQIWNRVDSFEGKPKYQDLRDIVGACYFRSKKGGMVDDRTQLLCGALLSLDCFEFGLYGGTFDVEPSQKWLVDDWKGSPTALPPWYVYDCHTGVGKRMIAYLTKVFPYSRQGIDDMWFFKSSALVNEVDEHSMWWGMAEKIAMMTLGFKLDEVDGIWAEIKAKLEAKLPDWIEEQYKVG